MATYNGEKYITEQILSIYNQVCCNVAILISDDNSNDNTLKILKNLKDKFKMNLKVIKNKNNNNSSSRNLDYGRIQATGTGTATQEVTHCTYYLFNFNNSSEYNYLTNEEMMYSSSTVLQGSQGGLVHTVAQASSGLQFYMNNGNIASGTFTLYGLAK